MKFVVLPREQRDEVSFGLGNVFALILLLLGQTLEGLVKTVDGGVFNFVPQFCQLLYKLRIDGCFSESEGEFFLDVFWIGFGTLIFDLVFKFRLFDELFLFFL